MKQATAANLITYQKNYSLWNDFEDQQTRSTWNSVNWLSDSRTGTSQYQSTAPCKTIWMSEDRPTVNFVYSIGALAVYSISDVKKYPETVAKYEVCNGPERRKPSERWKATGRRTVVLERLTGATVPGGVIRVELSETEDRGAFNFCHRTKHNRSTSITARGTRASITTRTKRYEVI